MYAGAEVVFDTHVASAPRTYPSTCMLASYLQASGCLLVRSSIYLAKRPLVLFTHLHYSFSIPIHASTANQKPHALIIMQPWLYWVGPLACMLVSSRAPTSYVCMFSLARPTLERAHKYSDLVFIFIHYYFFSPLPINITHGTHL